jgi:hypothetical protein
MQTLSATCLAIALAANAGTLQLVERPSRFGDTFIAIEDAHGVIEVALTRAEADERVSAVKRAFSL